MNKPFPEKMYITNEFMKRYSNLLVLGEHRKNSYMPIRNTHTHSKKKKKEQGIQMEIEETQIFNQCYEQIFQLHY